MAHSTTTFGPGNFAAVKHGSRSPRLVRLKVAKSGRKLRRELEAKSRAPLVRLAVSVIVRREMVEGYLTGRRGQASRSLDSYDRLARLEFGLLLALGIGKEPDPHDGLADLFRKEEA
jgi:hypothetical protein